MRDAYQHQHPLTHVEQKIVFYLRNRLHSLIGSRWSENGGSGLEQAKKVDDKTKIGRQIRPLQSVQKRKLTERCSIAGGAAIKPKDGTV